MRDKFRFLKILSLDASLPQEMNAKSFKEIFNDSIFERESILIDERMPQNCDFFILELVKHFGYSIFMFNDSAQHMENLLGKMNLKTKIKSAYSSKASQDCQIYDDIWAQKNAFGTQDKARINIFRSGTANTKDYYEYDLIIKIEGLASGCSADIDGIISVFFRNASLVSAKYKIHSDKIDYFI